MKSFCIFFICYLIFTVRHDLRRCEAAPFSEDERLYPTIQKSAQKPFLRNLSPLLRNKIAERTLPAHLFEELSTDFDDLDGADEFDVHGQNKRHFDDYGHLRFGKRGDFDDYGHLRFGRTVNSKH